ncbi:MAG TPA: 30S ribosomal protein S10 [Candidatus Paceibacterota bacterium]|nr:30S ribosomal protein S10 [Candidatus Paceibacterota bacterium]
MAKTKQKEKLRIKVRSYDAKLIDKSVKQIIDAVKHQGGEVVGPVPLPTEVKDYTVNRSTFVHNKSKDQFEMKIHKRLIDVLDPEEKTIEALSNLNLPSGIDIEIKSA